jgi:carboxyl-terminal processing protease
MIYLKNILQILKKYKLVVAFAIIGLVSFKATDTYFEISKNMDLFVSVFKEINTYYVDEIDAGKLTKRAIDEMLNTLDPYTNYISEAEAEDFRFQMTGQYGGVGAQIAAKGDYVVITDPYEGYPAQKEGLLPGDIIVEIEGKSNKGKSTTEVSKLLKGQAGSKVNITIKRNDVEMKKSLMREEIKVKNVPYFGMINAETGIIKLTGFTNDAGKEVRDAFLELKKNTSLKNVILDVRGNPGGLLHEAVNIVNIFVPQGQEVVSTKGKVKEWEKIYKTLNPSTDESIPLVVLTNRGSASASEIVSGTIQDLDRGIIIGKKTFGKGLVQSTRPLNYNAQIKITTAKYYTPSGRCIQALDYSHKNEDGSVGSVVDSLKKAFKTKAGRKVFDGGGVDPDINVEPIALSKITESLISKQLIFDFATAYRNKNASISDAKSFKLSENDFNEFKTFIANKDYEYNTATETALLEVKKKAEDEKYFDAIKTQYDALKLSMNHDKQADIEKNKEEIISLLEEEIVRRYYFQKGRIEAGFNHDLDVQAALKIFADKTAYKNILTTIK